MANDRIGHGRLLHICLPVLTTVPAFECFTVIVDDMYLCRDNFDFRPDEFLLHRNKRGTAGLAEGRKRQILRLPIKLTPLTDISGVVFCIQPVTLLPMAISGSASQNLYFLFRYRVWEAL